MERTSVKYVLQIDEAKHSKEGGRVGRREGGEGTNKEAVILLLYVILFKIT